MHALEPSVLAQPGITFVSARDEGGRLLGCGALKDLARYGFVECGPFSDYRLDPFSHFMTRHLLVDPAPLTR